MCMCVFWARGADVGQGSESADPTQAVLWWRCTDEVIQSVSLVPSQHRHAAAAVARAVFADSILPGCTLTDGLCPPSALRSASPPRPLMCSASDSANLDRVAELLVRTGMDPQEALMLLVPEAYRCGEGGQVGYCIQGPGVEVLVPTWWQTPPCWGVSRGAGFKSVSRQSSVVARLVLQLEGTGRGGWGTTGLTRRGTGWGEVLMGRQAYLQSHG